HGNSCTVIDTKPYPCSQLCLQLKELQIGPMVEICTIAQTRVRLESSHVARRMPESWRLGCSRTDSWERRARKSSSSGVAYRLPLLRTPHSCEGLLCLSSSEK